MSCEAIVVMVLELSCKALSSLLPLDEGKLVKDLNVYSWLRETLK